MDQARELLESGRNHRLAQRSEEAFRAIAAAARLAPDDPAIALADARVRYETWRPATESARRAAALAPMDPSAQAMLATAMAAEGAIDAADDLLRRALAASPTWLAGHRQLMQMRLTADRADGFDRTIAAACASQPHDVALRMTWFQALVAVRDWDGARAIVGARGDATSRDAPTALRLARLFLASESDEASPDPHLFDEVAGIDDVGFDLARTRHHLRTGQFDRAAAVAQARTSGPAARAFWAYLSLAWRAMGDARAQWLDRDEALIRVIDLGLAPVQLCGLAKLLRRLLTMAAPFPEQSVRGGVQTDRQLFFHPDAAIRHLKDRVTAAVRSYVQDLPPLDPHHPLAGADARSWSFEGSWAVLLRPDGYHAPHTHSRGWLSSALHIELAEPATDPDDRQGWIEFGSPPPELELALGATRTIGPAAGRVTLFPSTTWHRTVPFARGERLSIAFDVRRA